MPFGSRSRIFLHRALPALEDVLAWTVFSSFVVIVVKIIIFCVVFFCSWLSICKVELRYWAVFDVMRVLSWTQDDDLDSLVKEIWRHRESAINKKKNKKKKTSPVLYEPETFYLKPSVISGQKAAVFHSCGACTSYVFFFFLSARILPWPYDIHRFSGCAKFVLMSFASHLSRSVPAPFLPGIFPNTSRKGAGAGCGAAHFGNHLLPPTPNITT